MVNPRRTACSVASVLAVIASVSCGGNAAAPTAPPTAPSPQSVIGPTAVLAIRSDIKPALGVLGGSLVFDASESLGTDLAFTIDFGDGEKTSKPSETHPLKSAGAKTAKLTVTDSSGRSSSMEVPYFVAATQSSAKAVWRVAAGAGPELVLQLIPSGDQLSGLYYEGGDRPTRRAISGTISKDRSITLKSADNAVSISGSFDWAAGSKDCLQQSCVVLKTTTSGRLPAAASAEFQPFDAGSVQPEARIEIRSDTAPSFGIYRYAPSQVFDASGSLGVGLTYRIDYGDVTVDQRSSSYNGSQAGNLAGAVTVTDLFGQTSRQTFRYFVFDTSGSSGWSWWQSPMITADVPTRWFEMTPFQPDEDGRFAGTYREGAVRRNFTGSYTDRRGFHMQTDDGAVAMDGAVEWASDQWRAPCQAGTLENWALDRCVKLRVTVRGGLFDGKTIVLFKAGQ